MNSAYQRSDKMIRIACMGDNCVDYYDETKEAFYGGNPVNVAVYLSRMGARSSYLGAVGTDSFGREMKTAIADKGVDVSHLQVCPGSTALTHVTIKDGDRILGDYEEGVMRTFSLREEDYAFIKEHKMAVTGLWGHCEEVLGRIRSMGVMTAFDCADRPDAPAAERAAPDTDILFFSDDESTEDVLRKHLARLFKKGPRVVVATRGVKGSLAHDGKDFYEYGIIPCDELGDTMGAGDSYIAGFLIAYLEGRGIRDCMQRGTLSSSVTLRYKGAW